MSNTIQRYFQAADAAQSNASARLQADRQGDVHVTKPLGEAPPSAAERKESLRQLASFQAAVKASPLYRGVASHVKGLFDQARRNADGPVPLYLSARFVQRVRQTLDKQVQDAVVKHVQHTRQIPALHMSAFTHALANGRLNLGSSMSKAPAKAVSSFIRMQFFPAALRLQRTPDSKEARHAAFNIGLHDLKKNHALAQVIEKGVAQGQGYGAIALAVTNKLHSQVDMLQTLGKDTLEILSHHDHAPRLFAVMERGLTTPAYAVPRHLADTFMRACVQAHADGNPLKFKADMRDALTTFQIMAQQEAAGAPRDAQGLRRQLLEMQPEVRKATKEYLHEAFGSQEHYSDEQTGQATRVTADIFSLAHLEAMEAAEKNGLASAGTPQLSSEMTRSVLAMNTLVNEILDKEHHIDEAFLNTISGCANTLYEARALARAAQSMNATEAGVRRALVHACLEGRHIPAGQMPAVLAQALDRLTVLTASLQSLATGLASGYLRSGRPDRQSAFAVAAHMMDNLRADMEACMKDGGMQAPAAAQPAMEEAPAGHETDLAALGLARSAAPQQETEQSMHSLPPEARAALQVYAPATAAPRALPGQELKTLLAEIQAEDPALRHVPVEHLDAVALHSALTRDLAQDWSQHQGPNLSLSQWQNRIRAGTERYVREFLPVMQRIDEQPEMHPRRLARDRFVAEQGRAPTPEEQTALYAALPNDYVILNAQQKDMVKHLVLFYGMRDADTTMNIVSGFITKRHLHDIALMPHSEANMAYALLDIGRTMDGMFANQHVTPEEAENMRDFALDLAMRDKGDPEALMNEVQRRIDSPAVRNIEAQATFMRDASCGLREPTPDGISPFVSQEMQSVLTAAAALRRLVARHGGVLAAAPVKPDQNVTHVQQVNHYLCARNSIHSQLLSVLPPLTIEQYTRMDTLIRRFIRAGNDADNTSVVLAYSAHRVLAALERTEGQSPDQQLAALWEAVTGRRPPPRLEETHFIDTALQLARTHLTRLYKGDADRAGALNIALELVMQGVPLHKVLEKQEGIFTLEDFPHADQRVSDAITSSNDTTYQMGKDCHRFSGGTIFAVEGRPRLLLKERPSGTSERNAETLRLLVDMAHDVSTTHAQAAQLLYLQSQAGFTQLEHCIAFLGGREEGSCDHDIAFTSRRDADNNVVLQIASQPKNPVNYIKEWTIRPDGIAHMTQFHVAPNADYGTSLETVPDVHMPRFDNTGTEISREITDPSRVDHTLMVGQGLNACFIASIINGMLNTTEGRQALKERMQGTNLRLSRPLSGGGREEIMEPLQKDNTERDATLALLREYWQPGDMPLEQLVGQEEGFSGMEMAIMNEYKRLDPAWSRGRMGFAQMAAPLLGFHDMEELPLSVERSHQSEQASGPEDPVRVRAANRKILETAAQSLALPGRVPIYYRGTAYSNGDMTGHYMAVVGVYGMDNREQGIFGLIVHDSATNSRRIVPLDTLTLAPPQHVPGRGTGTDRAVLTTLTLQSVEQLQP